MIGFAYVPRAIEKDVAAGEGNDRSSIGRAVRDKHCGKLPDVFLFYFLKLKKKKKWKLFLFVCRYNI